MKISKELISEVLDIKIEDIIDFKMFMNELFYYQKLMFRANCQGKISEHRDSIQQSINIYEFAYKCKEWAWCNFKIMLISHYTGQCYINGDLSELKLNYWNKTKSYQVEDNTEIEAIIKACEWILKKKD